MRETNFEMPIWAQAMGVTASSNLFIYGGTALAKYGAAQSVSAQAAAQALSKQSFRAHFKPFNLVLVQQQMRFGNKLFGLTVAPEMLGKYIPAVKENPWLGIVPTIVVGETLFTPIEAALTRLVNNQPLPKGIEWRAGMGAQALNYTLVWMLYAGIKERADNSCRTIGVDPTKPAGLVLSGFESGFALAFLTGPVFTVQTKQQNAKVQSELGLFRRTVNVVTQIAKKEGAAGFFRGVSGRGVAFGSLCTAANIMANQTLYKK